MKTYRVSYYISDHEDDVTTFEVEEVEASSPGEAMVQLREKLGGRITDSGPFAHVMKITCQQ